MKWEITNNTPIVGEVRFTIKFAWLPTRVLSKITITDHVVWLQLYLEEQVYRYDNSFGDYVGGHWHTVAKTIHT